MRGTILPKAALVTALLAVPAVAEATTADAATPAGGTLTLYSNPNFTGTASTLIYADCAVVAQTRATVGSFDNRPPAGCQVVLSNGAATFVLCAGRGNVPDAFRFATLIRIQPGASAPCGVVAKYS
jgi:hypothetical protein